MGVRLIAILTFLFTLPLAHASDVDWPNTGNDKGGMRYSPLKQIHRGNVKDLQVAWTFHSGDGEDGRNLQCTPIVLDGVMYLLTVKPQIVALDPTTGRELWRFNPYAKSRQYPNFGHSRSSRGLAYWSDGKRNRRIIFGTPDARLISVDARTGQPDPTFGKDGEVDLREGLEPAHRREYYGVSSAPMVFEDRVFIGVALGEGPSDHAPGDIRAFDARTGKEVWRFHTVPRPGEFGNETWVGESWKDRSGTNPWSGFTLDSKRGILYCGTGSPTGDFNGSDRHGANLFANCTLAIDARTGRRLWHFQTVHHDLWDHDIACPPVLCTVRHGGKRIDAVAQPTKTGFVYLLDRVTGKPLFGMTEVPALPSDIPGEKAWPTQPEPVKPPPIARVNYTEAEVSDISPDAHAYVLAELRKHRFGTKYSPPSVEGTVVVPGFYGGVPWSGGSFDPETGLLFINTNNVPCILYMHRDGTGGYDYVNFLDKEGYPAIKPPWGELVAVDLNRGEIAWRAPLGEYAALKARAVPPTGAHNLGGTLVTAGGLVFVGASMDEMFRAFDKATGKVLWEVKLPAGGYAAPCTYAVKGRQYVVMAAGGGGYLKTKSSDTYVAFRLMKVEETRHDK